jgi:S1-C subfamily serine protease
MTTRSVVGGSGCGFSPGLRVALLVGLVLGVPGQGAAARVRLPLVQVDSLEELAAQATRAVVLIDAETPSGSRQGSGFLVDSSGRILTNHHVIRDARSVRLKLASGDIYDGASVLAVDERRDIAVLQIPGFELPALPLGNSDSVRIGTPVVLIGSPLGLENTVTTGIVSGRRQEPEGFQLLQVSAPASQGSSGGPVLSLGGEVVGIASSQMQAGQNLNFAVPINYARGLLTNIEGEPVAVLRPTASSNPESETRPMTSRMVVNRGLSFDLGDFGGYRTETLVQLGADQWRRTRITYQVIETLGGEEPRVERYVESQTTRRSEPFGTEQTIHRERSRSIATLDSLTPVSSRGETAWWTGESWKTATYDLEFADGHVRGIITDTVGPAQELDRELPEGIVTGGMRDLAFATLLADSLVGRSVELVTFEPRTGDLVRDRFDVLGLEGIQVAGESQKALRVNVASGLTNTAAYFRAAPPRILLRQTRESDEGGVEEVTHLEIFPARRR